MRGGSNMNPYIGHETQISGVEESELVNGKGKGMRLLRAFNGKGMELTIAEDRGCDIARLTYRGMNMSYFSPGGYVAPAFYDDKKDGFLKSFTAGFLTTSGLQSVGVPCTDAGEELPLHGSINNTPAERVWYETDEKQIVIKGIVNDSGIFARKLELHRTITISKEKNEFTISDCIKNVGDKITPVQILYHMNMGYPLLSEKSQIFVPSDKVSPRTSWAEKGIKEWDKMMTPTANFEEQCYYHEFENTEKKGLAAIYNPDIDQGLAITYDAAKLPFFTEWKMMGVRDYVLGLEPGNCNPDGRDKMRESGKLVELMPEAEIHYQVTVTMLESEKDFVQLKNMKFK